MATARRVVETVGSTMNRAVHIRIQPRTKNIRESREILRTMKEYGDIVSFKNKQYDIQYTASNVIIAVFREKEAAERFVQACPLSITVAPPPPPGPVVSPASMGILQGLGNYTKSLEQDESRFEEDSLAKNKEPKRESGTEFLLHAALSRSEQARVPRRQPFYWGYEISHHPSYTRDDLAKHVPLQGLCDIERRPELSNDKVVDAARDLRRIKTLRQMCDDRDAGKSTQPPGPP